MAHIRKMNDKPRTLPWRAHVHRKGCKPLVKMHKTRADAERWAAEQERSILLQGLPLTNAELKKITVADIVRRYVHEITPAKACADNELPVLMAFAARSIGSVALAYVTKKDAYAYIEARLKDTWRGKPITPRTVRREVNSIQHVFEVAKEQWGYSNLVNPFRGISIRGSTYRRKRRLAKGELERLAEACKGCLGLNRQYVPLALYTAIETGMRLQEIFNLTWQDIDLDRRVIEIRKSKTDYLSEFDGRSIVLPYMTKWHLAQLKLALKECNRFKDDARIFPMTKGAFKQCWSDVVKRAGITDLTFHDLRREAGSRFDEAGLTKAENDLMMGHANRDMSGLYIRSHLKSIQDKLDRHSLFGMTGLEADEKLPLIPPQEMIPAAKVFIKFGLAKAPEENETSIPYFPKVLLHKLAN